MSPIIRTILIFSLFIDFLISQPQTADFFIVRNPADFEILNQYQQKLTFSQKRNLLRYTPWQVVTSDILLSDNYTKAVKVKFDGQIYYLVQNDDENLIANAAPDQMETYKNCLIFDEVSEIIMDNAVMFREIPFSLKKEGFPKEYLISGTVIKKLFKKGASFFVKEQSLNRFGWVRIINETAVKSNERKKKISVTGFAEVLVNRINQKIFQINSLYSQLYQHLNEKYSQEKAVPYWEIISSQNEIKLNLKNENPEKIEKSMTYLVNDFENMITGQTAEISSSQGQIVLKLKNYE